MTTTMQLDWRPHGPTTALYAAHCIALGLDPVDPRLAPEMAQAAASMQGFLLNMGMHPEVAWRRLIGQAIDFETGQELAERFMRRLGRDDAVGQRDLAELSRDILAAGRRAIPDFQKEMELRVGPLRQQWEARGPGLLRIMTGITDQELFVERALVVMTSPILGGGGLAYLDGNRVVLEAVLANPEPELPEVLRLGWLLSQLNLDLPRFSEEIPQHRRVDVAQLAMAPVVLCAGEKVELTSWNESTLGKAIQTWRLPLADRPDLVDTLFSWWETHQETRVSFVTALPALDRMLG